MLPSNKIVISLGGSVINPSKPDISHIEEFAGILRKNPSKFIIFVGGGGLARDFQKIASKNMEASHELLDELGIIATKINAELLKAKFGDIADKNLILDPNKKLMLKRKVAVGGGWKPGASTDDCAVRCAAANNIRTIVNISNTTHIYDKHPRKHMDAKPLTRTTWKVIQSLVGTEWIPGLNMPFDPIATKLAAKKKMKMVFLGPSLKNFSNYLSGKEFEGTVVD
ncbi:MAG: UMP kinase [Nanoarchaeota archaeon]